MLGNTVQNTQTITQRECPLVAKLGTPTTDCDIPRLALALGVLTVSPTFVNDFTWIHCVSFLFNTVWFMLLLIGLTFLTPFPGNMLFNHSKTLDVQNYLNLNVPQILRNVALLYFPTNGSSVVNGCLQYQSPNR